MRKVLGALAPLFVVVACSGGSNNVTDSSTSRGGSISVTGPAAASEPPTATEPSSESSVEADTIVGSETTQVTVPAVVPFEGSMQDLVAQQPTLSNISEVITAWLADSPGREGVLRNGAGITLFLPNDDGFSDADVATSLADFDAFTIFLSEHLKVGVVTSDQFGTEVTTAMTNSFAVGNGPTIGGQAVVEADITGTNGVLHIIAGPFVPVA